MPIYALPILKLKVILRLGLLQGNNRPDLANKPVRMNFRT